MLVKKIIFRLWPIGILIRTISLVLFFCTHISMASIANTNSVVAIKTPNNFSAFSELLIVNPAPRIQLQFPYSFINTDYATVTIATGGTGFAGPTGTATANLVSLVTTTATGSSALLSSNRRLHYKPGQGSVCEFTAIYGAGIANNNQIVGIGNSSDGFFYGYNGTLFGILWRSSSSGSLVNTWISQANWNVDGMNGSGPSGITLNPQTGNLYKIQFAWLGFGVINFYIANPNGSGWILVHQIQYPNNFINSSVLNASMQLYAQTINTAAAGSIQTLKVCSMAGMTEGFTDEIEDVRNSISTITAQNTPAPATNPTNVLAIQNQTTFNGKTNQVRVLLDAISLLNTAGGGNNARVDLYLNPTLSGTLTYTPINTTGSVVQFSTTSVTVTSGKLLMSFYCDTQTAVTFDLDSYNIVLNPGDVLVIAGQGQGGTATMFASLTWSEGF